MSIDSKLAGLLSDFFLDIAKAFFVATTIVPTINGAVLIRGLISATIFIGISRFFLEFKSKR